MNNFKVKVKSEYVEELNNILYNFEIIPFLFNNYDTYIVTESNKSLFISTYNKELEYCIKGLDMNISCLLYIGDMILRKQRRIFFPAYMFKKCN